ncbi:TPA: hypothetical protein ACFPC6_001865, partial [Neisseria meningitidis]
MPSESGGFFGSDGFGPIHSHENKNLKSRHSRKSGNLVYPASAISDTFPHASIPSFLRFQSFPITPWFFISRFPP